MANCKDVLIKGIIRFDACDESGDTFASDRVLRMLGMLNLPSFGLRIEYGNKTYSAPNEHGGRTAFYEFAVKGVEAIREAFFDEMIGIFASVGELQDYQLRDVENDRWLRSMDTDLRVGLVINKG